MTYRWGWQINRIQLGKRKERTVAVTSVTPKELLDHAADDHKRGCQGREYTCDCRYDMKSEQLLVAAAGHIKQLEQEIEALQGKLEALDKYYRY